MRLIPSIAALCGLAALGCAGGPTTPLEASDPTPRIPQASLGDARAAGPNVEMPLGLYTVTIDPTNVTAMLAPKQVRSAAEAGEQVYELCASDFFPSPAAKIRRVEVSGSVITMTYDLHHPFAAPSNLDAPATAANRADLGISGRCVFLVDGDDLGTNGLHSTAFFTDPPPATTGGHRMNHTMVANPHGYCTPGGMLDLTGFSCDTFPYLSLVDETDTACRTSSSTGAAISNPQGSRGNYDPTTGWQRSNMGPNRDSWTGMSVLHQGQAATGHVDFSLAELDAVAGAGGTFSLDMAILATYNDPRGGTNAATRKANRLPGATADVTKFHYDMPKGTCAIERVIAVALPGSSASGITDLTCSVADYSGHFSSMSGSTTATIKMCAPGLLGDSSTSVDFTSASPVTGDGSPENPFTQVGTISFPPGTPPGDYPMCVRYQAVATFSDGTSRALLDCDLAPVTTETSDAVLIEYVLLAALIA